MRWFFYNEQGGPWDFRTPDKTGIGNSETAQIEVSRRLADRGHEVYSFSPEAKCTLFRGVRWRPVEHSASRLKLPGTWVVSRSPAFLDNLPPIPGRRVWFVSQDVEYGEALSKERLANVDRLLALCPIHAEYLVSRYPTAKDKITVSSNGVRVDLAEEVEKEPIERNPYRLVYTSSPDRGLIPLLAIFKRAREFEPRLELVVCYGFENLEAGADKTRKKYIADIRKQMDQPGIIHKGRLPQPDLYRLLLSAGMWVYCTNFQETGCASNLEAQALGAVPVFSPLWALEHNGGHGFAIQGNCDDPLTRARFARAIVRLAWDIPLQERIRAEMIGWARRQFDWERVADHYEAMAYEPSREARCA